MRTPELFIAGIGTYIPDVMPAEQAVREGLYDPEDHQWYGWTGAAVAGDMPAPDMAIHAAREAMRRSGVPPHELDAHFHACSHEQGPEGWSAQHYILHHLTDHDIPSFRTWQACNGFLSNIELAASYIMAVPERIGALLTGSDNVGTPTFNRWAFGLQNGVVGDGASALVLTRRPSFARLLAVTSGSTAEVEAQYRGAESLSPAALGVGRRVDFKQRLSDAGDDLGETLAGVITRQGELRTEIALRALSEADIRPDQVARVTHVFTGQESYLKIILDPIGLRTDQGLLDFGRQYGHLTVNDQIIGLEHLVRTRQVRPGDHVIMIGHGGGVSITCAVVRVESHPDWASGES